MADSTTIYDIKLRYGMEDRASRGLQGLAAAADSASRKSLSLTGALKGAAAVFGVTSAFSAIKDTFVGFNAELETMRISLSSILYSNFGDKWGGNFQRARVEANSLFKEFKEIAKQSPLSTKEIIEFGNGISAAFFTAGGSIEQFKKVTEQGAMAAKILGFDSGYGAVGIQEILTGAVNSRMRFANQLMSSTWAKHGMDRLAANKAAPEKRIQMLLEALELMAGKAKSEYETSYGGQMNILKERFALNAAEAGEPLFKLLTAEAKNLNGWLESNKDVLFSFGNGLKEAALVLKSVLTTLAEHKDLLLAMGGIWLANKGVGAASGALGRMGGFFGSMGKSYQKHHVWNGPDGLDMIMASTVKTPLFVLGENLKGAASKLQSFADGLGKVVGVLGTLATAYLALDSLANKILGDQKTRIGATGELASVRSVLQKEANGVQSYSPPSVYMPFVQKALEYGLAGGPRLDEKELYKSYYADSKASRKGKWLMSEESDNTLADAEAKLYTANTLRGYDLWLKKHPEITANNKTGKDGKGNIAGKPEVNVNINKIEVASDDPDRFVHDLVGSFEEIARNPNAAKSAMYGWR